MGHPLHFKQFIVVEGHSHFQDNERDFRCVANCDPSRNLGAYLNFTLCLFSRSRRESKKNFWNVSEISLSHREHAVKNSRLP